MTNITCFVDFEQTMFFSKLLQGCASYPRRLTNRITQSLEWRASKMLYETIASLPTSALLGVRGITARGLRHTRTLTCFAFFLTDF